jgi:hypothetical protein
MIVWFIFLMYDFLMCDLYIWCLIFWCMIFLWITIMLFLKYYADLNGYI